MPRLGAGTSGWGAVTHTGEPGNSRGLTFFYRKKTCGKLDTSTHPSCWATSATGIPPVTRNSSASCALTSSSSPGRSRPLLPACGAIKVDHYRLFALLRAVVIDEVHALASDDRGWHLLAVLQRLAQVAGRPLQRVGLSATVGNPAVSAVAISWN